MERGRQKRNNALLTFTFVRASKIGSLCTILKVKELRNAKRRQYWTMSEGCLSESLRGKTLDGTAATGIYVTIRPAVWVGT
jgi:hypothetical protein